MAVNFIARLLMLLLCISAAEAQVSGGVTVYGPVNNGDLTTLRNKAQIQALLGSPLNGQCVVYTGIYPSGSWGPGPCVAAGAGTVTNAVAIAGAGITVTDNGGGALCNTATNWGCTFSITNTIAAGGPIGGAFAVPQVTYNSRGQLTTVSSVPIVIPSATVTNAMLANMTAPSVKGVVTTGTPVDLTPTQLTTMCNVATAALKGCLPVLSNSASDYFGGDGSFHAAITSVTNSNGTLTISPTTGAVIASLNLAHANTWTATLSVITNPGTITFDFETTGATGTPQSQTALMGKIFHGSAASPVTVSSPSISISRYDAINSAVLTGNNPALWVEVIANNSGAGNPNSNAISGNVTQNGIGDVVGVVGQGTMNNGTGNHYAYGGFFAANTTVATGQALVTEMIALNNSGFNETYAGTAQTTAVHLGSDGTYRAGAAIWVKSNLNPGFDVGIAFAAGSVRTAALQDDSSSVSVIRATGSHTNGVDFTSASMTTPFKSNGFSVSQAAIITASGIGVGVPYGALGTGINNISGSNTGQYIFAVQNIHGAVGDSGMVIAAGSSTVTDPSTPMITFFNSGLTSFVGSITRNGTNQINYANTSDRRLKENIIVTSRGLDELRHITINDFTWKAAPGSKPVQGFIAQDLYKVYPEAVTVGGDDETKKPWQVDYGRVTPLLARSIQELDNRVTAIEKGLNK